MATTTARSFASFTGRAKKQLEQWRLEEESTMLVAPCVWAPHKRHLTVGLGSRACNAARACKALTAGQGQIALE